VICYFFFVSSLYLMCLLKCLRMACFIRYEIDFYDLNMYRIKDFYLLNTGSKHGINFVMMSDSVAKSSLRNMVQNHVQISYAGP
jgi:hypothetical protein